MDRAAAIFEAVEELGEIGDYLADVLDGAEEGYADAVRLAVESVSFAREVLRSVLP